ncbi:MAG: glycosyltransferase family 4 protein [Kofleriaceae bacterium]|nr:glycosyltransferase family 4 protein [Kofleriaceae bacterium]
MKVAIVQQILPHYRIPFFTSLHSTLAARGVDLQLIYGQEAPGATPRTVPLDAPWAERIQNRYFRVGRRQLVWQPCLAQTRKSDLVIVGNANRSLVNYVILASRAISRRFRLAFWTHGRNFRSTERDRLAEGFKRKLARAADWWFAYTERSAKIMRSQGVPAERITVVDNAFDTDELAAATRSLDRSELARTRAELGIDSDSPVVVFCGGLRPEKDIGFVLKACEIARKHVPSLHLVVVGDGPEENKVKAAAVRNPWIHAIGPVFKADRVRYFAISEAVLLPLGVGLAVLDSFVTQTPLLTTDVESHGPESAYLEHDVNGLVSEPSVEAYANELVRYLGDSELRKRLRAECANAARRYTLANMVERFASGIVTSAQ